VHICTAVSTIYIQQIRLVGMVIRFLFRLSQNKNIRVAPPFVSGLFNAIFGFFIWVFGWLHMFQNFAKAKQLSVTHVTQQLTHTLSAMVAMGRFLMIVGNWNGSFSKSCRDQEFIQIVHFVILAVPKNTQGYSFHTRLVYCHIRVVAKCGPMFRVNLCFVRIM